MAKLPTGAGSLDLAGYIRKQQDAIVYGGALTYAHRLSQSAFAYARGAIESADGGTSYSAAGGLRWTWR